MTLTADIYEVTLRNSDATQTVQVGRGSSAATNSFPLEIPPLSTAKLIYTGRPSVYDAVDWDFIATPTNSLLNEGYGQPSIAPAANKITVSSFSAFQAACGQQDARVCIDSSLAPGTVWDTALGVFMAKGVTVDASTAPAGFGIRQVPNTDMVGFVCDFGDNYFFKLRLLAVASSFQTAGIWFRGGRNYQARNLEITGVNDDSLALGEPNQAVPAGDLTISDCWIHDGSKAILLSGFHGVASDSIRRVTILRNLIEGMADRTPNCAGVQEVQLVNNLIRNNVWGPYAQVPAAPNTVNSKAGTMLAESNVLQNNANANLQAWVGAGLSVDSYVNTDDAEGNGFGNEYVGGGPISTDVGVGGGAVMSPTYTGKMQTSLVESFVLANAGV